MRKKLTCLAFAGALIASFGITLAGTGAVHGLPDSNTPTEDCMGVERATRNSVGGDREMGGFGTVQAGFVMEQSPYGEWLQGHGTDAAGCPIDPT